MHGSTLQLCGSQSLESYKTSALYRSNKINRLAVNNVYKPDIHDAKTEHGHLPHDNNSERRICLRIIIQVGVVYLRKKDNISDFPALLKPARYLQLIFHSQLNICMLKRG